MNNSMLVEQKDTTTSSTTTTNKSPSCTTTTTTTAPPVDDQEFRADWDATGVYVYQAFQDSIADWALEHQTLGGPDFKLMRMTWIKPSFAWVLYRSGYARKKNQERILKIKIGHSAMAELLSQCTCGHGQGGSKGRVQWDPERDLFHPNNSREPHKMVPRKMMRTRSIQIGLSKDLSEYYVTNIRSIEDVTALAKEVGEAHSAIVVLDDDSNSNAMDEIANKLPVEKVYIPMMKEQDLIRVGLQFPR